MKIKKKKKYIALNKTSYKRSWHKFQTWLPKKKSLYNFQHVKIRHILATNEPEDQHVHDKGGIMAQSTIYIYIYIYIYIPFFFFWRNYVYPFNQQIK